jgi:hypothetical protein
MLDESMHYCVNVLQTAGQHILTDIRATGVLGLRLETEPVRNVVPSNDGALIYTAYLQTSLMEVGLQWS